MMDVSTTCLSWGNAIVTRQLQQCSNVIWPRILSRNVEAPQSTNQIRRLLCKGIKSPLNRRKKKKKKKRQSPCIDLSWIRGHLHLSLYPSTARVSLYTPIIIHVCKSFCAVEVCENGSKCVCFKMKMDMFDKRKHGKNVG
ncbi:hypothetical protein POVWA2_017570 [Plasmodium ovale wallikeri]|uniref:Uncharacterized protein n=1 Tax=Plasmodium ovale wallikeri TaxID=864142 RepID=A0A1A8YQS9_PLAOA|nr:hypothetical protein POVWA2_017570 [Plasmodium ovale wallikeri]